MFIMFFLEMFFMPSKTYSIIKIGINVCLRPKTQKDLWKKSCFRRIKSLITSFRNICEFRCWKIILNSSIQKIVNKRRKIHICKTIWQNKATFEDHSWRFLNEILEVTHRIRAQLIKWNKYDLANRRTGQPIVLSPTSYIRML